MTRHEWLLETIENLIQYTYKDGEWQGTYYMPDMHEKIAELRAAYFTYQQQVKR